MRNQREFLCIIFIFLMEYDVSEGTCERETCLGQFKFGHFLPRSIFTTKYKLSPYQCAIECFLRRQRCKSFNYRRSALSCQLSEEDSGPEGINLQPKAGCDHSNIDTWKNIQVEKCNERACLRTERCDLKSNPQGTCIKTECDFAVLKPGVTIQPSNETAVGTKARYRCVSKDMERGSYLTACLESTAMWSNTNFTCVCQHPPVKPGAINDTIEVEVGHTYTYMCPKGLFSKQDPHATATCLQDGSWTLTNFICVTQNWTEEIYAENIQESNVISNYTKMGLLTCMYECDKICDRCFSFFHDNNGTCVLSNSFQRGLPSAVALASQVVYFIAPSTSCDNSYKNVTLGGSYFCIKYYTDYKSFDQAMSVCELEKAKLLDVTTKDQIKDLHNDANNFWGTGYVFMGVTYDSKKKNWTKWTGEEVSVSWHTNEPNFLDQEHCVAIGRLFEDVININCEWRCQFVCNKEIRKS